MGGCHSSQPQTTSAPLARKGELVEAESLPYLAGEQKTEQYWVDPKELDADKKEQTSQKISETDEADKSFDAPRAKGEDETTSGRKVDGDLPSEMEIKDGDLPSKTKIKDEDLPSKAEIKDGDLPSQTEDSEDIKEIKQISTQAGDGYAIIYDESDGNIKLIPWSTYEEKYLPGYLEDRDKFLKTVKQPNFAPTLTPDVPQVPAVLEVPEIPLPSEVSEVPPVLEIFEVPMHPVVPKVSEVPAAPQVQEVPEVPAAPQVPVVPEVPAAPQVQEVPEIPAASEMAEVPDAPEEPSAVPEVPEVPETPLVLEIPGLPEEPFVQEISDTSKDFVTESFLPTGPYTTIYEAETESVKLISWDEYLAEHQQLDFSEWERRKKIESPVQPNLEERLPLVENLREEVKTVGQVVIYDESLQSIKLITWDHYETEYLPMYLAIRKERELSRFLASQKKVQKKEADAAAAELTTVYDPETQGIKIMEWSEYLKSNKPPTQDWTTEYDEKTQSVKLAFWKEYQSESMTKNESPSAVPTPDLTTIYDPITEGIKLVSWDEYLKQNKPPRQEWSTDYDEKTQSVKLVFWKQYQPESDTQAGSAFEQKECLSNPENPAQEREPMRASIVRQPYLTTVYDPITEGVKLITWDEYLKENQPPKQDWVTAYDEKSQSVKLMFWKDYQESIKEVEPVPVQNDVANEKASQDEGFAALYKGMEQSIESDDWDIYS